MESSRLKKRYAPQWPGVASNCELGTKRAQRKRTSAEMASQKKLRIGDWVEVRSKEEILQTLDSKGCLDAMPFMPEMLAFCGQRFRVYKIAHKTCDYTTQYFHSRRLSRTVHLETRCDGQAHGGCQAGCLLYWKEDWLRPISAAAGRPTDLVSICTVAAGLNAGCQESTLWEHVQKTDPNEGSPTYICQMTQVPYATTPIAWWDLRQYADDYLSGNVTLGRIISGFIYSMYFGLSQAGIGVGPAMRWLYDRFSPIWGGTLFPRKQGVIPAGEPTPVENLNLQPGEVVRVKSHKEILRTVDTDNKNRGMHWDAELVPYCGGTYKVLRRVTKLIGEQSGKMLEMKSACIILDSVVCQARYSSCRMFCPKAMYPYWREIWLERLAPKNDPSPQAQAPQLVATSTHDN